MKKIIIIFFTLFSFVSFGGCFKVDSEGIENPYKGEDLRVIGYTFNLKDQKILTKLYPDLKLVQYVFTGKLVPCSGDSCKGLNYIMCRE